MKEKDASVDLFLTVLRRLSQAQVLTEVVLIGSWCMYFYRDFFKKEALLSPLRTRDLDLLIPRSTKTRKTVDLPELLNDLGFVLDLHRKGYMRLVHPELIVDFLVPEVGRGSDRPYAVRSLGIKAQRLRFLDLLLQNTVTVKRHGLTLRLPEPITFALHKLMVAGRRVGPDKGAKDRQQAVDVLKACLEDGQAKEIRRRYDRLPGKWKKAAMKALKQSDAPEILALFAEHLRNQVG